MIPKILVECFLYSAPGNLIILNVFIKKLYKLINDLVGENKC